MYNKFTISLKLNSKKLEELKVLVNLFKFLKLKEFNKKFTFKIIKSFKNMIDPIIKNYILLVDIEMKEFLLIMSKETQKNLVVLHVVGLYGDYLDYLESSLACFLD